MNSRVLSRLSSSLFVGVVALGVFCSFPTGSPFLEIAKFILRLFPEFVRWAKGGLDESTFAFLAVSWVVGFCLVTFFEVDSYRRRNKIVDEVKYLHAGRGKRSIGDWIFLSPAFQIDIRADFGGRLASAMRVIDPSTPSWADWAMDDFMKCFETAYFRVSKTSWVRAEFAKLSEIANAALALAFVFAVGSIGCLSQGIGLLFRGDSFLVGWFAIVVAVIYGAVAKFAFGLRWYLRLRQTEFILSRFILAINDVKVVRPRRKGKKWPNDEPPGS